MRRPRLQDVARQAGVSEATVSRVLNGKPGVGKETRLQVLTALDVLGYERPAALRSTSAGLVGLVVPELVNPIFPAFAQLIESALAGHRYTPVLCTQTPGGVTEDEYVDMLLERGVAGIVFISGLHADLTADPARYHALLDRGLPIVLVNGTRPDLDVPCISTDDEGAVRTAVSHLAALGHTRFGLAVGPGRFVPVERKVAGFRAAVGADPRLHGIEEYTLFSVEGGHAAAARLLDAGATAIICGSDLMALGAIRAVRARGLDVPGDVSVVGYDDSPFMAFTDPPLTTVRQPVGAMSHSAVQTLVDSITGHKTPHGEYLFAGELVVRGSTGPAPNA
ncbi:MAG TPA: LacI family DNA-binding transcriptional regulator [Nocardioidaceae bacterium]|nr:LacI family DNA-binding transcriptional regulator [Nocardioidaceae bacterium]